MAARAALVSDDTSSKSESAHQPFERASRRRRHRPFASQLPGAASGPHYLPRS